MLHAYHLLNDSLEIFNNMNNMSIDDQKQKR